MNPMSFDTARVFYRHRQAGWAMIGIAALPLLFMAGHLLVAGAADRSVPHGLLIGALVLSGLALFGFSSMSITVTRDYIVARFGIGLFKRTIALDDVVSVDADRSRWYEGWGIHWTTRGMLYNVSGFDIVRLGLVGGKTTMLGTDDPKTLRSAINRALEARTKSPG